MADFLLGALDTMFVAPSVADFDKESWTSSLSMLPRTVAVCTISWGVLHLLLSRSITAETFGITKKKEEVCVHNNMISTTHAIFSFTAACIYFGKGWGFEDAHKEWAVSEYYYIVTGVSVGYILYDVGFLMVYYEYMKNQLTTILAHHSIFIFTYFLSQFVPCTLGMILYFWFSLTEISTPFLNYNWFFMKANFSKELWKKNGFVLLFTFGIRWIITLLSIPFTGWYIREHSEALLASQKGGGLGVVQSYLIFFSLSVLSMLGLNSYWYSVLLGKAFAALKHDKKAD